MDRRFRIALLPLLVLPALALFAYWKTWNGDYLFDDLPAIADNLALQSHDWWDAAFGERHQPLANRPLTCLSLVLDFAVFGSGPFGPHLTNLLLHVANALLLFATVRRAALAPNLANRIDGAAALRLATFVSMLWVVHPLGVDAVGYTTQRSTLLAAGFLLVALYATLRAHGSSRRAAWNALAVGAVALGMASKEDLVVAPILVVLFQRAFLLPSWRASRTERTFHLALAATWLVLAACVANGPTNPTVGTHTSISPWQWLMTQAGVIVHYLRLVVWPQPLRGAYDDGVVTDVTAAMLPGLVVIALLVATVRCWWSRPWLGWLGALFFLMLAPTSSVFPIETELVAERRMYLPMLFVLVPTVAAIHHRIGTQGRALRVTAALVAVAITIGLALVTRERVSVYSTAPRFWADAYDKREPGRRTFLAAQILSNQGVMLWQSGRFDEAHACYAESMACPNPTAVEVMQYAVSLCHRGQHDEGIALLRRAAAAAPENGDVLGALGTCLLAAHYTKGEPKDDPTIAEAGEALQRAVARKPKNASFWNGYGYALRGTGKLQEAERAYAKTCDLTTDHVEPFFYRAELLERLGRTAEIAPMFARLLQQRSSDVALRLRLADIDIRHRDFPSARLLLDEVLRLEPGNATAPQLLRRIDGAK